MGNEIKPTDMASEPEVVYSGHPKDCCHTQQQAAEKSASYDDDAQMISRRALEK